ncbi:MAG: CNNM domain-containing protein, partial [Cyanobacteria bacterium]|nr:CNNM domain-containing protein [Cyanobacteriota bacterium]
MVSVWAIAIGLIFLNSFFVAAEFATVAARTTVIRKSALAGDRLATSLLPILETPRRLDEYIATCQIAITFSSLILGAYTETNIGPGWAAWLVEHFKIDHLIAESIAAIAILIIFTLLQILIGELLPKSVSLQHSERIALFMYWPLRVTSVILRPFIWLFNGSGVALLKLLGVPASSHRHVHSLEEISLLLAESKDGGLLECFREYGVGTLGIEPARNIAEIARGRGIETISEFFSEALAAEVAAERGLANAVIANNVLAHVDDTRGFLAAGRKLIRPEGRVIVEAPYLRPMLDHLEYDTVYHEHLCYFSVNALLLLFESAGMRIARIDQMAIHGGSLRVWGAPRETHPEHGAAVLDMAAAETAAGMTGFARYEQFARDVEDSRAALLSLLRDLKSQGKVVAGYGAPAKGNTLLNYCGIGTDLLPYTIDRSTLKMGKFTPGMHIPVLPPEEISSRRPDYLLILPWN